MISEDHFQNYMDHSIFDSYWHGIFTDIRQIVKNGPDLIHWKQLLNCSKVARSDSFSDLNA